MLEPPFDRENLPDRDEMVNDHSHLKHVLARDVIRFHSISDGDYTHHWMIYPVKSTERWQVAENVAGYFHHEAAISMAKQDARVQKKNSAGSERYEYRGQRPLDPKHVHVDIRKHGKQQPSQHYRWK